MNRKKIPRQNPLPCAFLFLIKKEGKGELSELLFLVIFFTSLRFFKSGESNILRQAIHLFSNRRISYLLFD